MDNNSLEKPVTYTIFFGDKDKDLWPLVNSIPPGRFSMLIKDAVRAYIQNNSAFSFPEYKQKKDLKPVRKNLSIGKYDEDVYKYIKNIDKGLVSYKVKEIIRHYLPEDKKNTSADTLVKLESAKKNPDDNISSGGFPHKNNHNDLSSSILSMGNMKYRKKS
jgi:hypothetical protein